jgi:hypothetical protein
MPIVEGVATMVNMSTMGEEKTDLAVRVEKAMAQAVQDCYSTGVTDPVKVRAAILAARDAEVAKK